MNTATEFWYEFSKQHAGIAVLCDAPAPVHVDVIMDTVQLETRRAEPYVLDKSVFCTLQDSANRVRVHGLWWQPGAALRAWLQENSRMPANADCVICVMAVQTLRDPAQWLIMDSATLVPAQFDTEQAYFHIFSWTRSEIPKAQLASATRMANLGLQARLISETCRAHLAQHGWLDVDVDTEPEQQQETKLKTNHDQDF